MKKKILSFACISLMVMGLFLVSCQKQETATKETGGYGEEPAAGGYGEEPAAGGYGEEPAAGGYGEEPAAGGYGEEPAAGGYK